jgi:heme-degrading monooxygenase HmoA
MFGRSTQFTGDPANIDEGIHIFKEEVIPAVQGQPGFKGGISLSDRSSGKGSSITFWETDEDLRASESAANQVRLRVAREARHHRTPTVDRMEVTYFEVSAPVGSSS